MPRPFVVAFLAFVACASASGPVCAADLPPAVATDVVREKIVMPLREIGRVRARSALCSDFTQGAADAAESALDFDVRAALAREDLRRFDFTSELGRERSRRRVEADLQELVDSVATGRAELQKLKPVAMTVDDDAHDALIRFVDGLDGAKGRQLGLARDIAKNYGEITEFHVASISDAPEGDPFAGSRHGTHQAIDHREPREPKDPHESLGQIGGSDGLGPRFDFAGDGEIARDLIEAGTQARRFASLAGC